MIPALLKMKNFMCYRENVPPLDFEGIHVACLCGDNGSGKSSIFDAITWALWGEASRGKSDDDLIFSSPSVSDMEVDLEFFSGGDRYRVIRKHVRSTATKSGQTLLELQSYDRGACKSLSEHTKTQTQEKIQGLLHLDYQTFINSAMILQGRANEFSNKRPGERKEILANILDLSFYDQLDQQARASSESRKLESTNLERDIAGLASKLEGKTSLEETGKKLCTELQNIEAAKKAIDANILKYRGEKESLAARKEQLEPLKQQIDSKKNDLQIWMKRLDNANEHIERFNKITMRSAEIEKGYVEFQKAVALDEQLNEKLKQSLELLDRKTRLEKFIASAENTYNNERKILLTRITELAAKHDRLPQIQRQRDELLRRQTDLEKTEADIQTKRQRINEITGVLSGLTALNSELLSAMEELRKKMGMMSHAGATCPLCESELGPDGRTRIEHNLALELEGKLSQSKENTAIMTSSKIELAVLEKEIKQKESLYKTDRDGVRQQLAIREKEISEAENAGEELIPRKITLQKLEDDIRDKNYAVEERKTLLAIDQEQQSLGYGPAFHKQISDRKMSLKIFDDLNKELSEARLQYEAQQTTRADSKAIIEGINSEIEVLTKKYDEIVRQIADLPSVTEMAEDLELRQSALITEERAIRDRLAESREKLNQLALLSTEKLEKEKSLLQYKEEESIFAELARYFSKKGIQALIIEETLPEIENEANLLLGKMTDNRMSLTLETQRGTKKGDMIETLDIRIADELGTRTYDMYSGGEAFRIDLALRIAISRLLVRRAGASMPILIIDEGFGTQDSAGLEKLVETINAIQDDFEKVFIITHLDELKDKFPVLINVIKMADGSAISVSG